MTMLRLTPWRELEDMQRGLSRILDDTSFATTEAGQWIPIVDIRETDEALLVQAELPGIDKKDVKIEVKDNVLTLSGERNYEKDVREENVHRIERSYGKFVRSFSLPTNVDTDKVDASMNNGILEIRLPKKESAKPKAITVK